MIKTLFKYKEGHIESAILSFKIIVSDSLSTSQKLELRFFKLFDRVS